MTTAIEKLQKHTTAVLVPCKDKQEWLSERRIGGSSSPNLYGCGYGSAYSMWSEFIKPEPFQASTERQQIGLGLEPFVCNLYQQKFGGQVEQWPAWTLARHPEREYMHATPDAALYDTTLSDETGLLGKGPGSLSIKTWSEFDKRSWDEEPPLYVQIQLMHELAVLGWNWGMVAVLFGAQELRRYPVVRNAEFIADLYDACQEFWTYVTNRIAPPIDESRASAEAFKRLHPNDDGFAVRLPSEADDLIIKLEAVKETIKAGEAMEAGYANTLRELIGDHTFGVTPEGRVYSLKTTERKDRCCEACGAIVTPGTSYRTLRGLKTLPKGTAYSDEVVDYKGSSRKQIPAWIKRQMLADSNRCHWCKCTLTEATATVEHLVPLALGGTNERSNLTLSCAGCNQARGHDATLTAEQIVAKKNGSTKPTLPKWKCPNCGRENEYGVGMCKTCEHMPGLPEECSCRLCEHRGDYIAGASE